jgi:hypothetical protein
MPVVWSANRSSGMSLSGWRQVFRQSPWIAMLFQAIYDRQLGSVLLSILGEVRAQVLRAPISAKAMAKLSMSPRVRIWMRTNRERSCQQIVASTPPCGQKSVTGSAPGRTGYSPWFRRPLFPWSLGRKNLPAGLSLCCERTLQMPAALSFWQVGSEATADRQWPRITRSPLSPDEAGATLTRLLRRLFLLRTHVVA